MARLYLRQIRVDIGDSISVDALRIVFQVNRAKKPAMASTVRVYNLIAATASRIVDGDILRLTAGYPARSGVIMLGAITDVDSRREGVDRVTTLTLDVGADRSELRFAQSYGPGCSRHIVLRDVAAVMGLQIGDLSLVPDDPMPNYVGDAPVNDHLTALLRPIETTAAEVDGRLVFHPVGAAAGYSGTGTVAVSPDTGLVGSVTVTDHGVKFVTLLEPRIYPGTRIRPRKRRGYRGVSVLGADLKG